MHLDRTIPHVALSLLNRGSKKHGLTERGSALLATLCFAGVLSIAVAGYLAVSYRSFAVSNRELNNSHCIELAEIGMDDALWALNNGFDASWVPLSGNLSKTLMDSHPPFPDPSSAPFAYENGSKGQVVINYNPATKSVMAIGVLTLSDGTIIRRGLGSVAQPGQLFTNAIGASVSLAFANGGLVDSFDSTVSGYSAPDPAHLTSANSAAVIAAPTINLGIAQVYGFAATNPPTVPEPTPFLFGGGAKVIGPSSATGTTIDPTRRSTNPSQPSANPVQPSAGSPLTITGSTLLDSPGVYQLDSIDLPDGVVVTITQPVVLKVHNSVRTTGTGRIVVAGAGTLELQIDEYDGYGLNLQGAGIDNQTLLPRNVSILVGRSYSGNAISNIDVDTSTYTDILHPFYDSVSKAFYGSIYLPNDTISVANDSKIFGAMVGASVTFNGFNPEVHYDSALHKTNIVDLATPYTLVQLHELTRAEIGP